MGSARKDLERSAVLNIDLVVLMIMLYINAKTKFTRTQRKWKFLSPKCSLSYTFHSDSEYESKNSEKEVLR